MNQPQLLYLLELIFLTCPIQVARLDNTHSLTETDFFPPCIYVGVFVNIISIYHILMNGLPSRLYRAAILVIL